jgi:hypothetical protein
MALSITDKKTVGISLQDAHFAIRIRYQQHGTNLLARKNLDSSYA